MSKVCQLFSGSSGNSIYINTKNASFLVDIGVSAKRCEIALRQIGVDPSSIDAVFVTHEHSDHIKGIRVFANKYNIPVYATLKCSKELESCGYIDEKTDLHIFEYFTQIKGVRVESFAQSHDSVDCVGYKFFLLDGRKVCVCTDTGYITDSAREHIKGSDLVFLESNHEVAMLENGAYPYPLKKRILGTDGHLSNFACSEFAVYLAKNGTTRFVLCHLSKENNVPEVARLATLNALESEGFRENVDFRLYVSPQINESGCIVL